MWGVDREFDMGRKLEMSDTRVGAVVHSMLTGNSIQRIDYRDYHAGRRWRSRRSLWKSGKHWCYGLYLETRK